MIAADFSERGVHAQHLDARVARASLGAGTSLRLAHACERGVLSFDLLDFLRAGFPRKKSQRTPADQPIQDRFALGGFEAREVIKKPNDVRVRYALQAREPMRDFFREQSAQEGDD